MDIRPSLLCRLVCEMTFLCVVWDVKLSRYLSSSVVDTLCCTAGDTVDGQFSGESWHIANISMQAAWCCQLFVGHSVQFSGQLITVADDRL